jgi:very-short-patch-repair endonuclease
VDVTVTGRDPGRKPGIRIHRVTALCAHDIRAIGGVPVASPARTLLDLGGILGPRELEQAVGEAYARRLVSRSDLIELLTRYPRRHGARALRLVLERDEPPARTRSKGEERLLELIRSASLPAPEVNARLGPYELDFLWRRQKLAVEFDGFAFHSSRTAFERDRARDADLIARGLRVVRVTWRQIEEQPAATVALIARAL